MICDWCKGPIRADARRDSRFCSKRCRQAAHRFKHGVGLPEPVAASCEPLRLAYADPPYPGLSKKYYGDHPDYAGEVDHAALIASLAADYDGWALSTSARALPDILPLCPPGVRVAAWFRGERPVKHLRPLSAWEPVIYSGGRAIAASGTPRRVDALVYRSGVRRTDPNRVIGAKPAQFCRWMFDLLGALPGDLMIDVFPGSGGVARAWREYTTVHVNEPRILTVTAAA